MVRLRQLVIAAESRETADALAETLTLGEPFADPGVAAFGLDNAVFAFGDQFLEVVWPVAETAPATRFLARNRGPGGYMVIFETNDLPAVRARAYQMGIRSVLDIDEHDDIAATHFHPSDTGGAIVSIDQPVPAGEWRWGGPDWRGRSVPGWLSGAELESPDPLALAARWGALLDVPVEQDGETSRIVLDGGEIRVLPGPTERLTAFHLHHPKAAAVRQRLGGERQVGGVRLDIDAD